VDLRDDGACIRYATPAGDRVCRASMVLDCSGRTGVIAVRERLRRYVPGGRMQALVGVWERRGDWNLTNPTHTFVETFEDGWAWSLATSAAVRHVGVMSDRATGGRRRGATLEATYRAQLALAGRVCRQVQGATLARVFACDASVYTSIRHAGARFALVGDAGSTLNPLSSFGVKKALASAWLAAIVANSCLAAPARAAEAASFFTHWESQAWRSSLVRSRDFAVEALARHPSRFWEAQATAESADTQVVPEDDATLLSAASVREALARLRGADAVAFTRNPAAAFIPAPIVRGNILQIEDAVPLGPAHTARYVCGVDLVELTRMAPGSDLVPVLFERYCSRHGAVRLPDFLGALSLLVARDVLRAATTPVH
jgi:flavin-dependent dehydrogenase